VEHIDYHLPLLTNKQMLDSLFYRNILNSIVRAIKSNSLFT